MFGVMIVDDDPKTREWFEVEIEWGKLGFDLVCSAKDGIDALNKLNQYNKLDLIISDIDIPKMSGIELLNSIKEYNLSSMIVLLSDADNMAHVKRGMLLGAYDYILKPMDKDKVVDVLKKAHEELMNIKIEEEKNRNLKKRLEINLSLSREKILQDLLRGKEFPFQELDYIENEYNISLHRGMVQVGIIEVGNFDADSRELIKSGRFDSLIKEVGKIISDILAEFPELKCNMVEMDIGLIGVILQPVFQKELQDFEDMTADFFERVLKEIKQDANMRATIGIGGAYASLRDVSLSYMGAKAALRHKYILGGNRVIHIKTDYNEKQNLLYPAEREKMLVEYIMAGDDSALKLAENIFDDIAIGTGDNLKRIAFAASQLVFNISNFIDMQYDFINKLYDFGKFNNVDFSNFSSKDEIKEFFMTFVTELLNVVKEYKPAQSNSLIKKACEYVLSHIDQEITLMTIADYLSISKNYFCSLFKQETGYNFLEYVTKVKMEWAKKLLREGNYKTYEVSEMLGYREASYFSRLFRKYTKLSPAEYKKSFDEQN
ncbi:response regulator transcription factor [Acetivibrio straminisolvens]|nr:response regulator [Acetivibrio straminisolvens]